MSAWCIIFSACSVIAVPRWLAVYILLRDLRNVTLRLWRSDICSFCMSVCLSWFSVCWQKRQFFSFSAYRQGFVSVLCGRLQCKSLLCGERARERGLPVVLYCNGRLRAAPAVCEEGDWQLMEISEELSKSYSAYLSTQSVIHFSTCSKGISSVAVLDRWCVMGFLKWGGEVTSLEKVFMFQYEFMFQFYLMLTVYGLRHMECYFT